MTLVIRTVMTTGFGVALGVGRGVGIGVGFGLGFGVGIGVGFGAGAVVASAVGPFDAGVEVSGPVGVAAAATDVASCDALLAVPPAGVLG